ncbi:hypothetical protein V8F20_004496 [Naviculisporaceae sp. PSN 640]
MSAGYSLEMESPGCWTCDLARLSRPFPRADRDQTLLAEVRPPRRNKPPHPQNVEVFRGGRKWRLKSVFGHEHPVMPPTRGIKSGIEKNHQLRFNLRRSSLEESRMLVDIGPHLSCVVVYLSPAFRGHLPVCCVTKGWSRTRISLLSSVPPTLSTDMSGVSDVLAGRGYQGVIHLISRTKGSRVTPPTSPTSPQSVSDWLTQADRGQGRHSWMPKIEY